MPLRIRVNEHAIAAHPAMVRHDESAGEKPQRAAGGRSTNARWLGMAPG